MRDLNVNVGSDNTLLGHLLAKHGLGGHNDNSNPPENIDELWVAIENSLLSGATQAVDHVPNSQHRFWRNHGSV